jgi:hypothetical protein
MNCGIHALHGVAVVAGVLDTQRMLQSKQFQRVFYKR